MRFLRSLVPRCGYNRNMSRAIRYAPHHMGGAGFKQLYLEQGTLLLQHFYKFLNSPTTTIGKLIRITLSWTQAFLGISQPILTDVHHPIPPVGPSLILDLRTFLREINGSLKMTDPPISTKLRTHDRFIMDIVLQQQSWKTRHIIQINACRRYLQAQTLADICSLSGTRILDHVRDGADNLLLHRVRISSFNQQKPGEIAWRTWRRFLLTITNTKGVLFQPLGPWIADTGPLRHWPQYIYNPNDDQLYSHLNGQSYRTHQRLDRETFTTTTIETTMHPSGYPTSVISMRDRLCPTKNFLRQIPVAQYDPHNRVNQSTKKWAQEIHNNVDIIVTREELRNHFTQGNVIMCSDGSVAAEIGTYGFIVATKQGQRLAKGAGIAPGAHANSFRSEAYGVLATITWLHNEIINLAININEPLQIEHHLDNKSVVRRIKQACARRQWAPNQRLLPEQDVVEEIVHKWHQLSVNIQFEWIRGHQDRNTAIDRLPLPAQLNCEADLEASQYQIPIDSEPHEIPFLPQSPCQLIIQNKSVTSKIKNRVYESATIPPLLKYIQKKHDWDEETMAVIDWKNYTHTLKKYRNQWSTIVKHIHGISPTGSIAHRNNALLPDECPACGAPGEDNTHVLICPHHTRSMWRSTTLHKLSQQDSTKSDPHLMDILQEGIRRFYQRTLPVPTSTYPNKYHDLIQSQNKIGWEQLYQGRWSTWWAKLQSDYHKRKANQLETSSGPQWVLETGRLLIDQWLNLWKLRNEERHGKDISQQQEHRKEIAKTELTALYALKNKVCPSEAQLFLTSPEEHLTQHSINTIEAWLVTHRDAIQASVQQAKRLGISQNRQIPDYPAFNPIVQAGQHVNTVDMQPG